MTFSRLGVTNGPGKLNPLHADVTPICGFTEVVVFFFFFSVGLHVCFPLCWELAAHGPGSRTKDWDLGLMVPG